MKNDQRPMNPTPSKDPDRRQSRRRDFIVAAGCGVFVALMVGMSFAAVPLYDWFCRTTGFGGTTQVAVTAPGDVLARVVNVRFDANIDAALPWRFAPAQTSVSVRIGEVVTAVYHVTNLTARETAGIAAYNVAPLTVGAYFHKINCFCFNEVRLKPGERQELTVVFYVDPALARDREQDDLDTITLSYSFFPVRQPRRGVAENAAATASGRM
ncbi:MAG: cytochrome c oxidase assembly protein [Proteobacteria bacterium]|nr:cytochrome c oxidase assembly protein [Pseudomonadota bacterium]